MDNSPISVGRSQRRKVLTASGFAHFVHDGLTDTVYVMLPLWAAGLGLSHAQVGLLKSCLSVGLALFQVPALTSFATDNETPLMSPAIPVP